MSEPTFDIKIYFRFRCEFCGEQLALGKMDSGDPCLLHYGTPCDTYLLTEMAEFLASNRERHSEFSPNSDLPDLPN